MVLVVGIHRTARLAGAGTRCCRTRAWVARVARRSRTVARPLGWAWKTLWMVDGGVLLGSRREKRLGLFGEKEVGSAVRDVAVWVYSIETSLSRDRGKNE